MTAYYNEIDPYAAQWLRNLITEKLIAPGDVDERSIAEVNANDLAGYTQCHFFAGIGGWSYALRLAGWPDARPVWTGSCPCQPFSAAGRRGGIGDDRHLWPQFYRLISECRPPVIFGEQVASKDGLAWLDIVSTDLEGASYAVGAADLCAAGVGAPHIRQRLYFVGHEQRTENLSAVGPCGVVSDLGDPSSESSERDARAIPSAQSRVNGEGQRVNGSEPVGPANASDSVLQLEHSAGIGRQQRRPESSRRRVERGRWQNVQFILCTDGKARPIEPGTFPLAHGVPGRVGLLRGYGNAIVPQVAAEFIKAAHWTLTG
jgi:DNA (cytosine-5)-methyltransferase 1